MNQLLAKVLHPMAIRRDPEGHTGAPRTREAGKPRRRWMLAALTMAPLVTVLSFLGTGVASASGAYTTAVYCNSYNHTITGVANAMVLQPGGSFVDIQPWYYSYQTRTWYPGVWDIGSYQSGPKDYTVNFGSGVLPPGRYYVEVYYEWYRSDHSLWGHMWDTGPDFWQTTAPWSNPAPSGYCYV